MTSSSSLLDAVDALTKPVKQARLMELDHEHDWLAVKIVRTKAEIRRVKRENKSRAAEGLEPLPIPELVEETGEWWCPWCNVVAAMPEHNLPVTAMVRRKDPSLLDQLEAAVGNSLEASGGSQLPLERTPADVAALQLALSIRTDVSRWTRELSRRPKRHATLGGMVRAWYSLSLAEAADWSEQERALRGWAWRIKSMLNPVPTSEIDGICPRCEFAFVVTESSRQRALQGVNGATYSETSVTCQVCGSVWQGREELLELANATRRLDGAPLLESGPFVG